MAARRIISGGGSVPAGGGGGIRRLRGLVDEEVNRHKTGEADGMNLGVGSRDEAMHI